LIALLGAALLAMFTVVTASPVRFIGAGLFVYDPQNISTATSRFWTSGSLQSMGLLVYSDLCF
jgi:hypothetical protein